jgi:UDP-N-acetylglucosamine 2-epimerase (non-hydrolysing)
LKKGYIVHGIKRRSSSFNTERPETVDVGANVLVGCDGGRIVEGVRKMIKVSGDWANPYGDGDTGERILEIIESN